MCEKTKFFHAYFNWSWDYSIPLRFFFLLQKLEKVTKAKAKAEAAKKEKKARKILLEKLREKN